MSKSCTPAELIQIGATPATVQWNVVRGDTATLRVDFYEEDEVTFIDTSTWEYEATAYDPSGDVLDELHVEANTGYVTITAAASITERWGSRYNSVVAELPFDLSVIIPAPGENTVWTPIIGRIKVLGDITPGGSL